MLRPLVQPKLGAGSRIQTVSNGLHLLATGGPKQRGDLVVRNPNLLRNAEEWVDATYAWNRANGRIFVQDFSRIGQSDFIRQNTGSLFLGNRNYRIRIVVDSHSGSGGIGVSLGGEDVVSSQVPITAPNIYNIIYTTANPINALVQFYVEDATSFSAQISFLGVYLLGPPA